MANEKLTDRIEITTVNNDDLFHVVQNGQSYKVNKSNYLLTPKETTLPLNGIVVDGSKTYHIESGVIKPALPTANHIDGKQIEIVSNPLDGNLLSIDLTDYPFIELQGGGFTESPSNIYNLETDLEDGLLKQHLTLMLWRRNNLFISNSMNYIPTTDIVFSSVTNIDNQYVQIEFNKTIQQSDLVISNFSKTFVQNGDTATDVSLDSITDSNGDAITGNEQYIRIYYTITGLTIGLANFTITATSLSDLFGNTQTSVESNSINLLSDDVIAALPNVVAYWKEGEGDNTTGTATKTDIKNSKVLSASGEDNPILSGVEWQFDGVNDGFRLADASINAIFNADAKDCQIHFVGNYKSSGSERIVVATEVGVSPNSLWNMVYSSSGTGTLSIFDANGDDISEIILLPLGALGTNYLCSIKFYQNNGNKIDVYLDDGTTITSKLSIDASNINVSNISELFVGMRETTSKAFYNVGFKSMVIANTSDNFDTIRTELAL